MSAFADAYFVVPFRTAASSSFHVNFEERKEYVKDVGDDKFHRKKSGADSFYLTNGSVHINCYDKFAQMMRKDPNNPDIEKYRYIIRFEIQYRYHKILYLKKQTKDWDTFVDLMSILQSDEVCRNELTKYYNKTIGQGDYLTLDGARDKIKSMNYRANKENRLIDALNLVSQCRGVFKANSQLAGRELKEIKEFKRTLNDLRSIGINPVTLPRECGIRYLPNLMKTYLDQREKQEAAWAQLIQKMYK